MSTPQTWVVVATTAQRFHLADLLLHGDIKGKGRKWDTALWRARVALGLIELTELLVRKGKVRSDLIQAPVSHAFTVTAENAEFLLECREKVEIGSGVSAMLRPLLEQLANPSDIPPVGDGELAPFDEAAEIEQWQPRKETEPPPKDAD